MKPFSFQKIDRPKERTIRVHQDDAELLVAWSNVYKEGWSFYEAQIDSFNALYGGE
jgi:hypothetical protein